MHMLIEVLVAVLAAGGLLALGWLLFGRLLLPVGEHVGGQVFAVVPTSGDGDTLEHDVAGLLWLRSGRLAGFTVVVVDFGLNETGRAVAQVLLERESGLLVCPAEHLEELLRQG